MGGLRVDVAHAGPERLFGLAPVFGRAFVREPMMLWPMGEHGDLVDRFTRCFASFLNAAADVGVVWEAGDAQGAAVWVPPDRAPPWERHPWNQPQISALTDDAGRRYDTFWAWADSHSPDEPLWQLDSIAVEPAVQGHGIGTALITAGLEQARADGLGAFLSTAPRAMCRCTNAAGFASSRTSTRLAVVPTSGLCAQTPERQISASTNQDARSNYQSFG